MKDVSPERWNRIDAILDGALDLPPEKRESYLDAECGGDRELRAQVAAMLGAGQVAGGFLENEGPAELVDLKKAVRKAADAPPDTLSGTHVGPYKLIRPIGQGGMGQVYLGVRDDQSYTRYVAVKVIRRGMDTDEILHRFRMERRILASLVHPNIARLLDGGATEDGVSYFVMEYIEGEPITDYCDARNMPVKERIALFRQVCSAVQFAHQNLIVHRDLKPSNILVTADGTPKLLDFGIAKVLNPSLAGYTMPMTRTEVRVMTPEYASPEQMRGSTVTTASDVYQLGILLYELLTGARPHRTEGRSRREIEDLVLSEEPERPSTAVSQVSAEVISKRTRHAPEIKTAPKSALDHLRKALSGDLDRIVLTALRKEPDRRYASADQLGEDLRRFLEGLPVSAQADTLAYRASKFVQRHKVGVAASAGLAILLIAVAVLAVRYAVVTSRQAERMALAAAKTEQVSRFLISTFQWANPEYSRGRDITVSELVDRAVEQLDRELAGQPEVQSHMLMELGMAYREMGNMAAAGTLLERALAMRRADPDVPRQDLAASLFELGVLFEFDGEWNKAEPLLTEALEIRQAELGPKDPQVAASMNELAAINAYQGRLDVAEPMLRRALAIQEEAFREPTRGTVEIVSNLAWVLHDRGLAARDSGLVEQSRGMLAEAEQNYRSTLALQRQLLGADHPYVATSLNNMGSLMQDTGRYQEAESLHREALALREALYGDSHPIVANSINQIGRALIGQGRLTEAEPLLREALARHVEQFGLNHPYVGRDRQMLANLLVDLGNYPEAESLLKESLRIFREVLQPEHRWTVEAEQTLGRVYQETGRKMPAGL